MNGWPEETYYRLLIPDYLPKNVKKFLYLDTDTIVDKDLSELFSYDLSNYSLGACKSPESSKEMAVHEDFLGIKRGTHFGAGILLINLERIRKNNSFNQLIKYGKVC